jgi:hypothetical protein
MMADNKEKSKDYLFQMRLPIESSGFSYKSSNSSKGSLLNESKILFSYLSKNNFTIESARDAVIKENILSKRTFQTRKRCWQLLQYRYFPLKYPSTHLNPIISIYKKNVSEMLKKGLLYYHYSTSDLFAFEVTIKVIYNLAHKGFVNISSRIVDEFLDSIAESHPEVNTWSHSTRQSLNKHYLSSLRDFGILEGKVRKKIHRPRVEQTLFLYIASVLKDCGKSSRDILASDDFKLFLLTPAEVVNRFAEASQNNKIIFKKSGKIVSIEFPWETVHEYIKTIG